MPHRIPFHSDLSEETRLSFEKALGAVWFEKLELSTSSFTAWAQKQHQWRAYTLAVWMLIVFPKGAHSQVTS